MSHKHHKGDTVTKPCKNGCGTPITYVFKGKHFEYCAVCRKALNKANTSRSAKKSMDIKGVRLKSGEAKACSKSGLLSISHMTQDECGVKLAIIEAVERFGRTGDEGDVKPIPKQQIQHIERVALAKLRRALGHDWETLKRTAPLSGSGGEYTVNTCPNPQWSQQSEGRGQ